MKRDVIADAGIFVAYLNRREKFHVWVKEQLADIAPPLITCEAALAEASFLLSKTEGGADKLLELLVDRVVAIPFRLETDIQNIKTLMARYANIPMSLADACLVRLSEQFPISSIMTLDADFKIYRKHRRQSIPLIIPA